MGTGAHPDGGAQPVLDSLSALQQVAGHCPRSAESLLRDGHYNGRVSAAVTTVAPKINLLTWVKCPASVLRDGYYKGREPKDASQKTRAKGREPKEVSQRTRAKGRESKDARPCRTGSGGGLAGAHARRGRSGSVVAARAWPMQSFRRGPRPPRVVAARRPLQWPRLGGRYNGLAMQSCLHVAGLGRSASWALIERARQSAPASRTDGELHHQGWAVCGVVSPHEQTKTVPSDSPNSNAEVNMLPKEIARQSVPASRAAGALHQSGKAV